MGRRSALVVTCLVLLFNASCFGQSIVIDRLALLQTRLIQTTKSVGTTFAVNDDDREYWITAKHIFTGIENAPPGVFTTKTVQAGSRSRSAATVFAVPHAVGVMCASPTL